MHDLIDIIAREPGNPDIRDRRTLRAKHGEVLRLRSTFFHPSHGLLKLQEVDELYIMSIGGSPQVHVMYMATETILRPLRSIGKGRFVLPCSRAEHDLYIINPTEEPVTYDIVITQATFVRA